MVPVTKESRNDMEQSKHTRLLDSGPEGVAEAAVASAGDWWGSPTETVYGLAADALKGKRRPAFSPPRDGPRTTR